MKVSEYDRLASVESSHWWYRSIHKLILDIVSRYSRGNIVDIGCGTGGLTRKIGRYGQIVGVDYSEHALSFASKKGLHCVQGSANSLPLKKSTFNLATSISVLYHRDVEETLAIKEMSRILKTKGIAIVVVPAFRWFYSIHDKLVFTKKRYTRGEIEHLLKDGGFKILESRYIFSFLFPIFCAKRLSEKYIKWLRVSDLTEVPFWLNFIFYWTCRIEWSLYDIAHIIFPFGSSIIIVAQK